MPDPAWPSPFHAHSLSTLTKDSIIRSQLTHPPCCAYDPALLPVVLKASHRCIVESVRISTKFSTKYQLSFQLSLVPSCSLSLLHLSPVWNTLDFHSFLCYSAMLPQNLGPDNSSSTAHKLKLGPSICIISGTPWPPGLELAHNLPNVKGTLWS